MKKGGEGSLLDSSPPKMEFAILNCRKGSRIPFL